MAQNRKDNYQDNEFVKDNKPFDNDLLGRKDIAQLWQDTLLKSGKHFVMAVDASWGMGKSYFARNWECKLLHDDYKVCYIDAFKYDFTDDPFMTITSNLIEAFEFTELEEVSNKLNTFFRAFKGYLGAVVPALVGGAVKLISGIPYADLVAEIASGLTDATGKAVKEAKNKSMNPADEVLQSALSYSAAMTQFRDKLTELIEKQNLDKPFIVIVDELDRCKPTYAIEFLEKLKHLFNIPNIIFILFINEDELANAISHTYGIDGKNYLGKFIQVFSRFNRYQYYNSHIWSYINKKYLENDDYYKDIFGNNLIEDYIYIFEGMSHIYPDLSYRDVDNILMSYKFLDIKNIHHIGLSIILKIIKLKDSAFYYILSFDTLTLHKDYKSVVPEKLQITSIYFDRTNSVFIDEFKMLLFNIHRLSSPYSGFLKEENQDVPQHYILENYIQKNALLLQKSECYALYLTRLAELADLNISNTR